jgi:adapter protein MecA 1/2
MGFEIDDIIGNSETTQRFMRLVMEILETEEHIDMDNVSPIVKAELLQDHSMTITFGSDLDIPPQNLVEAMRRLVESFASVSPTEIEPDSLLGKMLREIGTSEEQKGEEKAESEDDETTMICALAFDKMEKMLAMIRVCFPDKTPDGALYRLNDQYYLILDFSGWKRSELRTFAFGTVEYDEAHFSEIPRIAYVMEHGKCILPEHAVETLRQL